ncbi:MAG: outer membrane protein [Nitrospinales bacterium]
MVIPKLKAHIFLFALLLISIFVVPYVAFANDDADSSSDTWTGFYIGGHAGAGAFTGMGMDWGYDLWDGPSGDFDLNNFNKLMGAQAGYNQQIGNFFYGAEVDWSWVSFEEERIFDANFDHYVRAEMDWLSTVRARLGLAIGDGLA